jgi:hypothetical protein
MRSASKVGLRVAGLLAMAVFVAHCGGNDVNINTGGGVNPSAGTFTGTTGEGGDITILVGSIEAITLDCGGTTLIEDFSPPEPIDSDGSFNVTITDRGKTVHVRGTFADNNNLHGTIDDEDNDCDTSFDASRSGVVPTRTSTPTGGGTSTPVFTETGATTPTETATTAETPTGPTPTGDTPTPTGPTPTGVTATPTPNTGGCPVKIDFEGTSTGPILDTGWTGIAHDATVISKGKVTVNVSCTATSPPCGTCNLSGPIANTNAANYTTQTGSDFNDQRCSNNTSVTCTTSGDCSGGTCQFYFGTLLPLSAGGVSTCVLNQLTGTISGTANIESGASASSVKLISKVFSGASNPHPCPRCLGDGPPNDGKRAGTCDGGTRGGQPCDVNGSSPNSAFGDTSLDCPPSASVIGTLPIDLSNSTGTVTRTLSANSPNCRANGFTTLKCMCDTCASAAAEPCSSNADCSGGRICGGLRCQGGANAGGVCTVAGAMNSECPTGSCGRPGLSTQPNQCDDNTCSANGQCSGGPIELSCGPVATFEGCTTDDDCTVDKVQVPGQTCSVQKTRPCFTDNGAIGGSVSATGHAVPPVNGESNPTLAALFCIPPTSAAAVNTAAGLPGLGRLELQGHARELFQ